MGYEWTPEQRKAQSRRMKARMAGKKNGNGLHLTSAPKGTTRFSLILRELEDQRSRLDKAIEAINQLQAA